jgi:hypothetical protein
MMDHTSSERDLLTVGEKLDQEGLRRSGRGRGI